MTKQEMIQALESFDDNTEIGFVNEYGNFHPTNYIDLLPIRNNRVIDNLDDDFLPDEDFVIILS